MAQGQKDGLNASQKPEHAIEDVKVEDAAPSEAPSFAEIDDKTNRRLVRKIDWKLMPVVCTCPSLIFKYHIP